MGGFRVQLVLAVQIGTSFPINKNKETELIWILPISMIFYGEHHHSSETRAVLQKQISKYAEDRNQEKNKVSMDTRCHRIHMNGYVLYNRRNSQSKCSFKTQKIRKSITPNAKPRYQGSKYRINSNDILWNIC